MTDLYKDNSDYKVIFESEVHKIKFYAPIEGKDYHMSRYAAAGGQNVYSSVGIGKDLLSVMVDTMLGWANNDKVKDIRTNLGVMCNNLKQRMKYPVDEECALRMGAILSIAQNEAHDKADYYWITKKVAWAKGDFENNTDPDPELYAFFLTMGVEHTPAWTELKTDIINTEYFNQRRESLQALTIN